MRLCLYLAVTFLFTVVPALESKEPGDINEEDDEETELENVTQLSEINYVTKERAMIDISLNRESSEEECYVHPPGGELTKADLITIEGVHFQSKSKYVSCRVTIGPMTEDLLGLWRLCGKSLSNGEIRCRPVNIAWNSNNGAGWDPIIQPMTVHPVHFGGTVNSGVSEIGDIVTCHVVTPAGEDLVITTDMTYPHIEKSSATFPSLCSVLIKDITEDMLGQWLIYGIFRSSFPLKEVHQPLTFSLYNEDNPYEQAYNVTVLEDRHQVVHVDTDLNIEVSQRLGKVRDCIYTSPAGKTFHLNNYQTNAPSGVSVSDSSNTRAVCHIAFAPITDETVGEWLIIGKFQNRALFDERRLTFRIIKEDPENPFEDGIDRVIQNMTRQHIVTDMNSTHTITINTEAFVENESCHVITPDGRQYAFITGFRVPNVEIINGNGIECGIVVKVATEDMIGDWTLIARSIRLFTPIEKRLSFTIRVEENYVLQNDIRIKQGADLYLHLNGAIYLPETCLLFGPDGEEFTNVETDSIYKASCGYVVRDVDQTHNGTWIIENGDKIKRRGSVNVQVIDFKEISLDNMQWTVGDPIDISVGPNDAVYCIIQDSSGNTLFDNFGQCQIVIDRVTIDHQGTWTMSVGVPGTVLLQQYGFYVNVHTRDGKPLVTTTVEISDPSVMLTCSLPGPHEVYACKFRDPSGNILVSAHGVGQDGYMFNGSIVNYESDAHSHDCTLRLINPSLLDLGIWRCALFASTGIYYGFLTVVSPHLMQDTIVAASVVTEPKLESKSSLYLEGTPVTLSCSIPTALRYCYFRADNGTIYNVNPRMPPSDNFEYVGMGLDAGECGIRFKGLSAIEARGWTCHVGLANTTAPELRTNVPVHIIAAMVVRHYWNWARTLVVEARVYDEHALDYCRFINRNGDGFTSDNLPEGYKIDQTLHMGFCTLYINNPCTVDLLPWTIVAKLTGADEISKTTTENLIIIMATSQNNIGEIFFWTFIIVCATVAVGSCILIPKKNREWTYRRASSMSSSFINLRNSMRKKQLVLQQAA